MFNLQTAKVVGLNTPRRCSNGRRTRSWAISVQRHGGSVQDSRQRGSEAPSILLTQIEAAHAARRNLKGIAAMVAATALFTCGDAAMKLVSTSLATGENCLPAWRFDGNHRHHRSILDRGNLSAEGRAGARHGLAQCRRCR